MPARLNPRTIYAGHHRRAGTYGVGAALSNGVAVNEMIPILGVSRLRVHFKATCAGTLAARMAEPDGADVYGDPTAVSVAVVANTDVRLDVDPRGEAYVQLRFTPSADGVVTFCDISGL